jgi:hypothetical protein
MAAARDRVALGRHGLLAAARDRVALGRHGQPVVAVVAPVVGVRVGVRAAGVRVADVRVADVAPQPHNVALPRPTPDARQRRPRRLGQSPSRRRSSSKTSPIS